METQSANSCEVVSIVSLQRLPRMAFPSLTVLFCEKLSPKIVKQLPFIAGDWLIAGPHKRDATAQK